MKEEEEREEEEEEDDDRAEREHVGTAGAAQRPGISLLALPQPLEAAALVRHEQPPLGNRAQSREAQGVLHWEDASALCAGRTALPLFAGVGGMGWPCSSVAPRGGLRKDASWS